MRCLDRDRREVLVSFYESKEPVLDGEGRLTGRFETVRSEQVPILATVSAVKGEAAGSVFGQDLDYDRTLTIDDPTLPIDESSVFWVDVYDPTGRGPYGHGTADIDDGTFDDWFENGSADGGSFAVRGTCDKPYDYVVRRVSRTPSYLVVALKYVEHGR